MIRMGWTTAPMTLAVAVALMTSPASHAAGLKDCSLKYKAAKTAGTLNGADWKTFRATQCGTVTPAAATTPSAAPGTAATTTTATATTTAAPAATASAAPTPTAKPSPGAGHAGTAANATFPSAIDPKYAKLSAGKGRMKTCLDQYHANKASNANGGLNWIAKDGYYSQCNTRLKGA